MKWFLPSATAFSTRDNLSRLQSVLAFTRRIICPRMNTNLQVAGHREKQWKADCIYVPFVYILCTIFRIISYNYQRVTASKCTIAYKRVFSESSQSQKTKQSHVCYPLVSYRDRTCLRILFFVGFSTYSPYRENTFSLQGEHLIPARRKHYPCRESRR